MTDQEESQELSKYEFEDRVLESLKQRDGEATVGDVAADTGLPYDRVETVLRRMLTQYKSHLDVDDDGNLRYRFDPSFTRRGEDPGRWWHRARQWMWKAFVAFFKAWTMVMLVGYTVVFVLILVGLSIAALTAGDEDSGGGEIAVLPFYLLARMLEFLFWWDLFSYGGLGRRAQRLRSRRKKSKPEKPFYEKIFRYLFGPDGDQQKDPLATEKAFTAFVRNRRGRVTAAEWASRSGQSLDKADNALTASIMRFRGDVDVSDEGSLVYRFDELRVTADEESADQSQQREPQPIWNRMVELPPLTGNPKSTNVWITILNGFNLVMSSIVTFGLEGATLGVTIGLGWVPFIFSAMFFAVPLFRRVQRAMEKKKVEKENQRRKALGVVFESANSGEAEPIQEHVLPEPLADDLMVDYEGDVDVTEDGDMQYVFPEIARQYDAAEQSRQQAANENVIFGQTVFSSDEDEKSLEESEMDDFDERLSRELGSDVTLEDLESEIEQSSPQEMYTQSG